MIAFHGARQGTGVTPQLAAATMHDGLEDEARVQTGNGKNVPIHPACEGSDKQGYGGDPSLTDQTDRGSFRP